ncbi:MAG TPA: ABC transporter permease [Candidatus Hydrogenedentes bacterium]|nr:ABC transporter permease [Candidatus Hydrogenedentota bacterium]HPG66547.1 ABC transporter permease [Candidatus Hydrogenedentota bacterium]
MTEANVTVHDGIYRRCIMTSAGQQLLMLLRQKRIILATSISFVPILIPLALAFLSIGRYGNNGQDVFVQIIENIYVRAMAPLLALFFGSMLVGEDVEMQTIPYILTRPAPRSAWVLGKFAAYLMVTSGILATSIVLTFAACTALGGLEVNAASMKLLSEYISVDLFALWVHGALCTLLGALVKRPVVFGVVILFGWQRIATIVPGVVDFLTIEKYITTLLPPLAMVREAKIMKWFGLDFPKQEYIISNYRATLTLLILIVAFLGFASHVVRRREYSSARAMGS